MHFADVVFLLCRLLVSGRLVLSCVQSLPWVTRTSSSMCATPSSSPPSNSALLRPRKSRYSRVCFSRLATDERPFRQAPMRIKCSRTLTFTVHTLPRLWDALWGIFSHVQGKFSVIKSEIRADAPAELQAIKNAAAFIQAPSQRYVLAIVIIELCVLMSLFLVKGSSPVLRSKWTMGAA